MHEDWLEAWRRARERSYGEEQLSSEPPGVNELDWRGDPLLAMQERAMERQRQEWLLAWEKARRVRDRRAVRLREQGYREEDIEARLGRQQEVRRPRSGSADWYGAAWVYVAAGPVCPINWGCVENEFLSAYIGRASPCVCRTPPRRGRRPRRWSRLWCTTCSST
mgnify:CR=1 FL=1